MASVTLGLMGFWPGLLAFLLIWLFVMATGLLYVEALLVNPRGANVASISSRLIGPFGNILGSTTFIILNYSYLITYFALSSSILTQFLTSYFDLPGLHFWYIVLILAILEGIIFMSLSFTFLVNFIFMAFFFVSFIAIVILGIPVINETFLSHTYWLYLVFGIPVIFDAFFYQSMLPMIVNFLERDRKKIKIALWVGVTLTLVVFLLWSLITIGSQAYDTFLEAFSRGKTQEAGYLFLSKIPIFGKWILPMTLCTTCAAFLVTGASFVDFWGDLFKISLDERNRAGWKRAALCALVFVPSLFFTFIPSHFLNILNLVTEFGELLIGGILPIWWIWNARYTHQLSKTPLLGGGKWMLGLLGVAIFFLFYFIGINIIYQMEWSTIPA